MMKALIATLCLLASLAGSATPKAPVAAEAPVAATEAAPAPRTPKRAWASEAAVALKQSPEAALELLKAWKEAGGLKDPQYWQAGAYTCLALSQAKPLSPGAAAQPPTLGPEGAVAEEFEPKPDPALLARGIAYLEGGAKLAPQRLDFFEDRIRFARLAEDLPAELKALESFLHGPRPKSGRFEREAGAFLKLPLAEYQLELISALAQEHFADGEEAAGEQAARLLLKAFPRSTEGQRLMAGRAEARSDRAGQLYWLEQALALEPGDAELWYSKAFCLREIGKKAEAGQALDKVEELDPEDELRDRAHELRELLRSGQ